MSESEWVEPSVAQLPDDPEALIGALAALEQPDVGVSPLVYLLIAVCALLVLLLVAGLRRWWRMRQRRREALRWRGAAEHALAQLRERLQSSAYESTRKLGREGELDAQTRRDILAEASVLARRVALVTEPREVIAPLSGDDWLAELDRLTGEGERFQSGAGRALAVGPYEASPRYSRDSLGAVLTDLEALIKGVANRQRRSFASS